jgi:uncharacterized protein (TIGR00369 family)
VDDPIVLPPDRAAGIRASFASQGLMGANGAVITALAPGRCTIELPFSDRVSQQNGFFHGGIVGAIADTAGGYAALTLLPGGSDVLTVEYKINFVRPAVGDKIIAEGVVIRAGRSVSVTRVDVYVQLRGEEERKLCAALQQTIIRASNP